MGSIELENLQTEYIGGSQFDWGGYSVLDSEDNLILVGRSASDDFEVVNTEQEYAGKSDAVIRKYDKNGGILFSTYFGGNEDDYINHGLIVDKYNNIIVVGFTNSQNFPTTSNPFRSNITEGEKNTFLAKFSSNGDLIFSTIIGAGPTFNGAGVTVDDNGDIVVASATKSSQFPTINPIQSEFGGLEDGTV